MSGDEKVLDALRRCSGDRSGQELVDDLVGEHLLIVVGATVKSFILLGLGISAAGIGFGSGRRRSRLLLSLRPAETKPAFKSIH